MYVYVLVLECANVCICVCVCVMRMHAHFGAGSPCSLLLSPLCEACPPLEGPGVPAECVEVASSWSLQEAGFWGLKRRESERGIHPSIRASIHIPPSKPQTRSGESRKGGERGGEGREGETQRERERERETVWVRWKSESDICKSAQALWGSFACLHSPGRAKSPAAYFPASRQSATPLKITDEEKETNALKQLAISQNTVIKVFH